MDKNLHSDAVQPITQARLKAVRLSILSDEDAGKLSSSVIGSVHEVSSAALGLPTSKATECSTCGAKNARDCEGHFGLINFPFTILNPHYLSEIAQALNKICPGCKYTRSGSAKKSDSAANRCPPLMCRYCHGNARFGYPKMKFRVSFKDAFVRSAIIAEVPKKFVDKNSGFSLASGYWDVIPKDTIQVNDKLPPNKRVLSPAQVFHILKDGGGEVLEQFVKRKNSLFQNSLLVTPNSHRVREFNQHITYDKTTQLYRKLIDFRGTPNELSVRVLDRYKLSKLCSQKVSKLQKTYEKESINESASNSSGLRNIRDLLLGKRTDHCFRMVVVGDPRLNVGEIGLPSRIAEKVLVSDHINSWNWGKLEQCCDFMLKESGCFSVQRNNQTVTIWTKDMLRQGDSINRQLLDGDIVLINRPPSIHQHSLIALTVKILPINYVVSINPLICDPLRGDFDGDCLHGYVPRSVEARVELKELVALDGQLVNGQDGRSLLSFGQDSLTGAHLLLENSVVMRKAELQQLQMLCSFHRLSMPAIMKSSSGPALWTGMQLLGDLLPQDFEFIHPSKGYIRHGEVVSSMHGSFWLNDGKGSLFQHLVRCCREKMLDFLTAGQEVICEWLTRRGLSVSLSDIYLSSDAQSRENLREDIDFGLQEAEKLSEISLLLTARNEHFLMESSDEFEDERKAFPIQISETHHSDTRLFRASISALKSVSRDMQSLVYKHTGKNNSFMAMLEAGSKGNLKKLFQHSICVGLQHTLAPVAFPFPRELSCVGWNDEKNREELCGYDGLSDSSYIPCAMVGSSFLDGLNPMECFMLSLATRDSTFGGHADVSGDLTRKLMFFMRDLMIGYDGTVRSNYGNRVVQFEYCMEGTTAEHSDGPIGGHPVGSMAACAIIEAAYSALDQPVSMLEPSPLLNLKKVLYSGARRSKGSKSASLFLSKRFERCAFGFEYGALEVKDHLESLTLGDVVSEVKICFSSKRRNRVGASPWDCHFHIDKEVAKKKRLKLSSVLNALNLNRKSSGVKWKMDLPLHITSKACSEMDDHRSSDSVICITATLTESFEEFSDLDILCDMVKPALLKTVIKGFPEFKKIEIVWRDEQNSKKSTRWASGELFLRVVMSDLCDRKKFWNILVEKCLGIRKLIDWNRSHPDDILDCGEAYGVDFAWQRFVKDLHSAIVDTGKTILPEHLVVTANCLSATGEFVPLSAKGLAHQLREADANSPFAQACFSNPSESLVKAAKMGQKDSLQGSLEALAWGQTPSIGTGCKFDILCGVKEQEPAKPLDCYSLLETQVGCAKPIDPMKKSLGESAALFRLNAARSKSLLRKMVSEHFSVVGIQKISQRLKRMLKTYRVNSILREQDRSIATKALQFHPRWDSKVGTGILDIKVGRHPDHKGVCFFVVRTDGTEEDFSYRKCINHALELITPNKANANKARKENPAHIPGLKIE